MTFEDAYVLAQPHSLIDWPRLRVLWDEAQKAPPGPIAEVGVYQGGSALLFSLAAPERPLHLFDTFQGHPDWQADGDDGHPAGRFSETSQQAVQALVPTATIHPGAFPVPHDLQAIALVHCDVDLYRSTKAVCEDLFPKLVPGGVLICDDYQACPGAKRAIHEYANQYGLEIEAPDSGQALLRKVA